MIKKCVLPLAVVLFMAHSAVFSMYNTKALRTLSASKMSRSIGVNQQESSDNFAAVAQALNNIDKRLDEQNKLLQVNFELNKLDIELRMNGREADGMDFDELNRALRKLNKASRALRKLNKASE
jgi:hypothetical protein